MPLRDEPLQRPLRREMSLLLGALITFSATLIVALLALVLSIWRMDRLATTADAAQDAIAPIADKASLKDLQDRLEILQVGSGISRVELYRGDDLRVATGSVLPSAEVLTRAVPGGRLLIFFDASLAAGGRRSALVIGALATMATLTGLLLLIIYVPQFVRPVEEMLAQARRLTNQQGGDEDARYLVHTFRDAVERIQRQSQELDHLRDAASSRTPDIRELSSALNQSISSGFVALDADGKVVAINPEGRRILGLPGDSADLEMQQFPASFAACVEGSLRSRTAVTRQEVTLEQPASVVGVTTVPLFEEGAYLGMFALFTDLTTYRAMEGRLRDLENLVALGQTAAGIAHEFRNSLFTILGYLRLAGRTATEEVGARIRSAENEAQRLAAAVDALLNFARPLTLRMRSMRLDELARAVAARAATEVPDVRFETSVAAAVAIEGDLELLDVALENIVRNAVDAVRQRHPSGGGRISIEVRAQPHPAIEVRDNGVGLAAAEADTYLLPFQSGKSHGFGLGLPLARKIALHHGGTLTLSGTPDQGAVVRIEFFSPAPE